ncbi:MAG: hydroxysqualene dehydroxylase HpnE [Gammaproteobacteria bacterium]|nr:hydroxysqualene dehydroxylase HpnE [Gammaproteobacteria bacterium]
MTVVVVGGGWAGLAAAISLSHQPRAVTLLESAPQLGGRARVIKLGGRILDNGQHLVIGAYHRYLYYLQILGVDEREIFDRQALSFTLFDLEGMTRTLKAPHLPAPIHLLIALVRGQGFTAQEKLAALKFCARLSWRRFVCDPHCSVADILNQYAQPPALVRALWEPLCIATLNTPIASASAQVFLRVLRDTFTRRNKDSHLLVPRCTIGDWFVAPATDYLLAQEVSIYPNTRVVALKIEDDVVQGVTTSDNQFYPAQRVVLATPPHVTASLLRGHPMLDELASKLSMIPYEPIVTVYLSYGPGVTLGMPMLGVLGGTTQWVFDRACSGDDGTFAVVISAASPLRDQTNLTLGAHVAKELAQVFPHLPPAISIQVVREKRATFLCTPEVQALRPSTKTPIGGLLLAGDYVDTGYPATLEGAVISGYNAAQISVQ